MTTDLALNDSRAAGGIDLASAGRGIAATADASIAVAWVQRYAVVYNVVDQIVDTPLFPSAFWPMPLGVKPWEFKTPWLKHPAESPEDYVQRRRIAAAGGTTTALWGEGYGWSPPQSWRLIYVANGKASLYAEGVNALLRAQGFGLEVLEREDTVSRLRIRRPGGPWVEYTFTMADAVRAGYVPGVGPNEGNDQYGKPKKGGNEKYNTDPKTMLWARNLTIAARIEAPDVIAGMPVAELDGDEPDDRDRAYVSAVSVSSDPDAPARQPGAGSAALRQLVADTTHEREARASVAMDGDTVAFPPVAEQPAPVPPVEEPPVPPVDDGNVATRGQLSQIAMLLGGRHGIGGTGSRTERLRIVAGIVERPLATTQELTRDEAAKVIDVLENRDLKYIYSIIGQPLGQAPAADEPPADDTRDGGDR